LEELTLVILDFMNKIVIIKDVYLDKDGIEEGAADELIPNSSCEWMLANSKTKFKNLDLLNDKSKNKLLMLDFMNDEVVVKDIEFKAVDDTIPNSLCEWVYVDENVQVECKSKRIADGIQK